MKEDKLSIIQRAVLEQIPTGNERPIKSKTIAERLGLSRREVMSVINALIIKHDIPIGAGRNEGKQGYYIITSELERQQAIVPLKHSIVNMAERVNKLEKIKI